jgi:ribosomal protein S18 acetylase RimI-like enzyme
MARKLGYGAIYLHAEGNNEGAIRLYESEGFEKERIQLRKGL